MKTFQLSSILHALIIGASDHSWWWESLGIGLVKYSCHSLQLHHHNPISSRLDPQSHPQFYTLECVAWFSYSWQSCAYVAFPPVNNTSCSGESSCWNSSPDLNCSNCMSTLSDSLTCVTKMVNTTATHCNITIIIPSHHDCGSHYALFQGLPIVPLFRFVYTTVCCII